MATSGYGQTGRVTVVRLTEVFRQAAQSRIISNAHRINQGSMPDFSPPGPESDFYFGPADDGDVLLAGLAKDPESVGRIVAAAITQAEASNAATKAPEAAAKPDAKAEPQADATSPHG